VKSVVNCLQAYCSVNREFANRTLQALRKSLRELDEQEKFETCPVVWIHDYQLLVAATTIRQVRPLMVSSFLVFSGNSACYMLCPSSLIRSP
jgi:trehalose-6-phosphate synthase